MPREVSRRTSKPPETKGKVSRPDQPGKRDLDPSIVRDAPDPALRYMRLDLTGDVPRYYDESGEITKQQYYDMAARTTGYRDNNNGPDMIQGAVKIDQYLKNLGEPTDGDDQRGGE